MSRKVLLVLSDHPDAASMVKLAAQDLYKTGRYRRSVFSAWLFNIMLGLGNGPVCRVDMASVGVLSAAPCSMFRGGQADQDMRIP